MTFKSSYIYALFLLILIIVLRENFNLPTGDRGAYFDVDGWGVTNLRNRLTSIIFSNLSYFGEVIFSLLYYKNVFRLSNLLINVSCYNFLFNKKIIYYSLFLSLLAPISLIFTSYAGKDLLGIFLTSEICIAIAKYLNKKKEYSISTIEFFKCLIYSVFLLIIRDVTAIFLILLVINSILIIEKRFFLLISILLGTAIFLVIIFWNLIYTKIYDIFYYQWLASFYGGTYGKTFSSTNPTFSFNEYLKNSYQMFTGINIIHFGESFSKSNLILLNNFLTYLIPNLLGVIYFLRASKIQSLFVFKALFLILLFGINGFLSQNNPAGAIRYMSSIIPISTTFLFVILPYRKTY